MMTPSIKFAPRLIIGMQKADALQYLQTHGFKCRITYEDGQYFYGTAEIDASRVNVEITSGVITNAALG